jgi:hypothetical protein
VKARSALVAVALRQGDEADDVPGAGLLVGTGLLAGDLLGHRAGVGQVDPAGN